MSKKTKRVISAGLIAAIAAFIAGHEGLRTRAYPDPGNPKIATICYGETQGVKFGDVKTPAECMEMLKSRIPDYLEPVDEMMPGLSDNSRIAYTDFAYNVGVARLQRSSIPGLEQVGRHDIACDVLLKYITASGRVLKGLVIRRQKERLICQIR